MTPNEHRVAEAVSEVLGEHSAAIAEALADCIEAAHEANPDGWEVTLEGSGRFIRVNAGAILVAEVFRDWTTLQFAVRVESAQDLPQEIEISEPFKIISGIALARVEDAEVASFWPALRDSSRQAVAAASAQRKRVTWYWAHSQQAVEALGRVAGRSLPAPHYLDTLGQESLEALYEQFLGDFGSAAKGANHAEIVANSRKAAAKNLERLRELEAAGEDLTDAALTGLLPHVATAKNLAEGAWISIAPAINRDIRTWFEGSGFRKHEDWPHVAKAIWRLVSHALAEPSTLGEVVAEFQSSGWSKGFQAGMISPFLSAVRPEAFAIFNSKSRKVLNRFAGTDFSADLSSYPSANRKVLEWCQERAALFQIPEAPSLLPHEAFDMFSHWLVAERKYFKPGPGDEEPSRRIWKIAPDANAARWAEWRQGAFVAIGWDELGDLFGASREEFEARRDKLLAQRAGEPGYSKSGLEQVWRFRNLQVGDVVVANRGTTEVLGIGEVVGDYHFEPGAILAHRVPVRWTDLGVRLVSKKGWRKSLIELDEAELAEILTISVTQQPVPKIEVIGPSAVTESEVRETPFVPLGLVATETHLPLERLAQWVRAIERKGQAILYGPPGTGKTFVARKLAAHLAGGGDGFVELLQFHPSYAYEDFIQGLRPVGGEDGEVRFEVIEGRFLDFCARAGRAKGRCVLILDEINRANLSRVFGELMYLLEYRGEAVSLAGGRTLSIPANVRLLGTMNTADRSIALVDHALRRRFAFLSLQPEYDILRGHFEDAEFDPEGLIAALKHVNSEIGDPNYSIGISFFLVSNPEHEIEQVWRMEIEPYLEELFFDQPRKLEKFRWQELAKGILEG